MEDDLMARPMTKVSASQQRSIVSRYKKGEGLAAIAEALSLGVQVIRRTLVSADVAVRSQGRPSTA